jgi:hypothetical protein
MYIVNLEKATARQCSAMLDFSVVFGVTGGMAGKS